MKTIALYSIKGGVGKTAASVNLAYLAARAGLRTLLWDLDPQGASSFYFRIKPKLKGGLLKRKNPLEEAIKGSDYDNLDLLPADFSLRHLDLLLDAQSKSTKQLQKFTQPLAEEYDLLLIDCAPSISLVSENVFHAADALLTPLIPTPLSLRTHQQLGKFLNNGRFQPLKALAFFSMVDRRKRLHRDIQAELTAQDAVLQSAIPYVSEVERMGLQRAPVHQFAPSSAAAQAYSALWDEVMRRLIITDPFC